MLELKLYQNTQKLEAAEIETDKVTFDLAKDENEADYYKAVGQDFGAAVAIMLAGLQSIGSTYENSAKTISRLIDSFKLQVELIAQQNKVDQPKEPTKLAD